MKRILTLVLSLVVVSTILLAGCNGTPKPPVATQINLDKLVTEDMTLAEVNNLMKPELKNSYTLYQATQVTSSASKSWSVNVPQGGFAAGETGAYQVIFFTPEKGRSEYYAIFFKANVCIGKAWFTGQYGTLMEKILKGENVSSSN